LFRLTVGRQLGLVVAGAILAITVLVVVVLWDQSNAAEERSVQQVDGITAPLASFIESELASAGRLLEVAASGQRGDAELPLRQLEDVGFIATEILDADTPSSRLGASSNFVERATSSTTVGSTRLLNGEVGVLVGTPVVGEPGSVLVGAYNAAGILVGVSAAQTGESTEALLAVRNSNGQAVIFTPSRHNDGEPVGEPDRATSALIDSVLDGEDAFRSTNAKVNGRDSVVTMVRIPQVEWVLMASTDVADTGSDAMPVWLIPTFLVIGALALVPIGLLRTRLKRSWPVPKNSFGTVCSARSTTRPKMRSGCCRGPCSHSMTGSTAKPKNDLDRQRPCNIARATTRSRGSRTAPASWKS